MVRDPLKLFAQAPWFDPIGITDRDLLNQYLVAGEYPGRIPALLSGLSTGLIDVQFPCKQY